MPRARSHRRKKTKFVDHLFVLLPSNGPRQRMYHFTDLQVSNSIGYKKCVFYAHERDTMMKCDSSPHSPDNILSAWSADKPATIIYGLSNSEFISQIRQRFDAKFNYYLYQNHFHSGSVENEIYSKLRQYFNVAANAPININVGHETEEMEATRLRALMELVDNDIDFVNKITKT